MRKRRRGGINRHVESLLFALDRETSSTAPDNGYVAPLLVPFFPRRITIYSRNERIVVESNRGTLTVNEPIGFIIAFVPRCYVFQVTRVTSTKIVNRTSCALDVTRIERD